MSLCGHCVSLSSLSLQLFCIVMFFLLRCSFVCVFLWSFCVSYRSFFSHFEVALWLFASFCLIVCLFRVFLWSCFVSLCYCFALSWSLLRCSFVYISLWSFCVSFKSFNLSLKLFRDSLMLFFLVLCLFMSFCLSVRLLCIFWDFAVYFCLCHFKSPLLSLKWLCGSFRSFCVSFEDFFSFFAVALYLYSFFTFCCVLASLQLCLHLYIFISVAILHLFVVILCVSLCSFVILCSHSVSFRDSFRRPNESN